MIGAGGVVIMIKATLVKHGDLGGHRTFKGYLKDLINDYRKRVREETIAEVLKIIDKASDENRNHVGVVQNDDMDKAYSIIWERVCNLKGDGYESSD